MATNKMQTIQPLKLFLRAPKLRGALEIPDPTVPFPTVLGTGKLKSQGVHSFLACRMVRSRFGTRAFCFVLLIQ